MYRCRLRCCHDIVSVPGLETCPGDLLCSWHGAGLATRRPRADAEQPGSSWLSLAPGFIHFN